MGGRQISRHSTARAKNLQHTVTWPTWCKRCQKRRQRVLKTAPIVPEMSVVPYRSGAKIHAWRTPAPQTSRPHVAIQYATSHLNLQTAGRQRKAQCRIYFRLCYFPITDLLYDACRPRPTMGSRLEANSTNIRKRIENRKQTIAKLFVRVRHSNFCHRYIPGRRRRGV
jgi:hypothetical protein